jgi:GntR family transcriptional regulator of vanillate catabolism
MSQTVKALVSLREMILSGEFPPSERLLETMLVERLEVSRTPIRAALARLAEEGLLEKVSGGGYIVREFTERDVQEAIDVRGTLEGMAARFAAERGVSSLALAKMKDCVNNIDDLLNQPELNEDDIGSYLDLNGLFHGHLLALAESFVIEHMVERINALPFASPNSFVIAKSRMAESWKVFLIAQEQHRGIVEAIEQREGSRAEYLAREHARLSLQTLRTVFKGQDWLSASSIHLQNED